MSFPSPPEIVLCVVAASAAAGDLRRRRIGNSLTAAALISALILHLLARPAADGTLLWLAGAASGLALFLPLYLLRGMAAGDVKLMAAAGAFVGPAMALRIALASMIAGGLLALALQLRDRSRTWTLAPLRAPARAHQARASVPYAVAVWAGVVAVVFQHA